MEEAMSTATTASPEQTDVESVAGSNDTNLETSPQPSTQQGNIFSRMGFDKPFSPNEPKWITGTSYRVSNRTKDNIPLTSDNNVLLETIDANSAKTINGERLQEIDQNLLNKLIGANDISCKALEHKQNMEYVISNLTAKRISIKHNYFSTGLFLPAFGSRTIKGKTLLEHEYTDWENQGLIKVETTSTPTEDQTAYGILGLLIIAIGIFLLVSIPVAIFSQAISWKTIGYVTAGGVVLMALSLSLAGRNIRGMFSNLNSWLNSLPFSLPEMLIKEFGESFY